jgi:hypothetical protein
MMRDRYERIVDSASGCAASNVYKITLKKLAFEKKNKSAQKIRGFLKYLGIGDVAALVERDCSI